MHDSDHVNNIYNQYENYFVNIIDQQAPNKSKKEGKDQESMQSSTNLTHYTKRHHKWEPKGLRFPSRWPQGINKQRRTKA